MLNLPTYYFQDIPADVMREIMDEMQAVKPEPDIEEIDHWPNCHNVARAIPTWCEAVGEFLSDLRAEHR